MNSSVFYHLKPTMQIPGDSTNNSPDIQIQVCHWDYNFIYKIKTELSIYLPIDLKLILLFNFKKMHKLALIIINVSSSLIELLIFILSSMGRTVGKYRSFIMILLPMPWKMILRLLWLILKNLLSWRESISGTLLCIYSLHCNSLSIF